MEYKKVSVILPCYNVEPYLRKCLDSVLAQDYPNYDIIAVNDGAKDGTLGVLREYEAKHDKIRVIDQKNKGMSGARNTGIDASNGEYIAFIDSDDVITPDYLSTLVGNLEKYDADLSICNFKRVKETAKLKANKKHKIKTFTDSGIVKELFRQKTFDLCVWNKLYRREILGDLRFNEDARYAEDIAFNYFYFLRCKKAVYDEKVCYFYIRRPTGLVNTPISPNKLSSFLDVERMVQDSEENHPEFIPYARGWKALVSLEFLYYVYKYDYKDVDAARTLMAGLKENMPYLKDAKRMVWHRRHLVPLGYGLTKILLGKKLRGGGVINLNHLKTGFGLFFCVVE